MNGLIGALLVFSLMGFADKLLGNRWGLGEEFEKGFGTLGKLTIPIMGIYCIGVSLARRHAGSIAALTEGAWTDPSILMGCILAPDLGAPQITAAMSSNASLALFSGVIVGACLGQFVGFQMPVLLSALEEKDKAEVVYGFVAGLIAIPAGLLAGGLTLRIPLPQILLNISIIAILVLGIAAAFLRSRERTVKVLLGIGRGLELVCHLMFALVALGIFLPAYRIAEAGMAEEILIVLLKMVVVISGGLVAARLIVRSFGAQVGWVAKKIGVNDISIIGLMLNAINSLAMLPMIREMDSRGKQANAAFAVSGSYMLGGQMVFVAGMNVEGLFAAFLLSKIVAGATAVALSLFLTRKQTAQSKTGPGH